MESVTLSTAVRNSLLSLQTTSKLIDRTQGRLATGLKVAGPVDDPVAFFQAKSLNDRAFTFSEKKDAIDQGISTVSAALDGVKSIETLVRQLKGVTNSMKSASSTQISDLVTQFNDLRTQINNLAADASFQGTNLINGTGTTLTVEFSDKTASILTIASTDLTVATAGLNVKSVLAFTGAFLVDFGSGGVVNSGSLNLGGLTAGASLTVTFEGASHTYTTADSLSFTFGTEVLTVSVGGSTTVSKGDALTINFLSGTTNTAFYVNAVDNTNLTFSATSADNNGSATNAGELITLKYLGTTKVFNTAQTNITFTLGRTSEKVVVEVGTAFASQSVATNGDLVLKAFTAAGLASAYTGLAISSSAFAASAFELSAGQNVSAAVNGIRAVANSAFVFTTTSNLVGVGDSAATTTVIQGLDSALTTIRSQAQTLGTNVATLQTRLDFTVNFVNTLEIGAAKLTLADLNDEGANLLALQTRQQLGIQALAFAGQAEQSILALFR